MFGRRSFVQRAVAVLTGAPVFAAQQLAHAEESDRPLRASISTELLHVQKALRRLMRRLDESEISVVAKSNAMSSLDQAREAMIEAQGYLTQGKSDE